MRHPITKYAVAAALILAALTGFTLFHSTGNITWAIEQSIEALGKYRAVLAEGLASDSLLTENGNPAPRPVRMWFVANADQTAVEKYRLEMDGVTLLVTDGHKTWKYEPQANRVTVKNRPYVAAECWLGSGLLEQLKKLRDAGVITYWQEASTKDPASAKPRVALRVAWQDGRWNGPRSLRLEFDLETKLLISLRQWENAQWQDPASLIAEKMTYYESLPDDLFQYQIPPGATVIEH